MNLREQLLEADKTSWIDIGCGGNFEDGFLYVDTFPKDSIKPEYQSRYFSLDILNCSDSELQELGLFDLVRMQHSLEHFTYEEGQRVLINCGKLLKPGGLLLITVPDLEIHINKYLTNDYENWHGFKQWANRRIPEGAPRSFYFSIFAYSMSYESHKWCYDYEGLLYQINSLSIYSNIKRIKTSDDLASIPFTHNRPEEDLCVLATKLETNF
jgi:predicted SAM-dependent methyltransferase